VTGLPDRIVLDGDPLDPIGGGARVGYARVSTRDQNLARQVRALSEAKCIKVFEEKLSGKNAERPQLGNCLDYLRAGDTLVVLELSRLGRSLQDLISLVGGLRRCGIGFTSLHENLDTTTPGGRLVFHVFAALAEFIRELIVEGTREGLDAARASGVRLGRPPAMTPEQVRHARDLLTHPDNTISSIARLLGVSRSTIYKYVPDLADTKPSTIKTTPDPPALTTRATKPEIRRPKPARITGPDSQPSPELMRRLEQQRSKIRASRCPNCGNEPFEARARWQQRQDLAIVWLYPDPKRSGFAIERHHCAVCQPHQHFQTVVCPLCSDGPMVAGDLADHITDQGLLPDPVLRWLDEHGWHDTSDDGLVCGAHPADEGQR